MLARMRRRFQQVCRAAQDQAVTYGPPERLDFGVPGSEGVSEDAARADHVHEMPVAPPSIFDRFSTNIYQAGDFVISSNIFAIGPTTRPNLLAYANGTPLGNLRIPDEPVAETGAWYADMKGRAGNGDYSGVFVACADKASLGSNGDTSEENHLADRVSRFDCRPVWADIISGNAPAFNRGASDITVAVGTLLTGSNGDLDDVTNGIYFESVEHGEWRAVCVRDGVRGSVGTGVPFFTSTGGIVFRTFRYDYDPGDGADVGPSVTFRIAGEVVATINNAAVIPSGKSVAGWGVFALEGATASSPAYLGLDGVRMEGRRTY